MRGLRILIVLLFAVAVGTTVISSLNGKPHPEIIVEMTAFLAALVAIGYEHGATKRALRRRALQNVITELVANAKELVGGTLMHDGAQLRQAMNNHGDGLRYYYTHLATTATRGALLSGALDGRQDRALVEHLNSWVHDADICNRRFMMSELRLFSATRDDAGIRERLRIHVSIVTGPAVQQRRTVEALADYIRDLDRENKIPRQLTPLVVKLTTATSLFAHAESIVLDLSAQFGLKNETVSGELS